MNEKCMHEWAPTSRPNKVLMYKPIQSNATHTNKEKEKNPVGKNPSPKEKKKW